MEELNRTESKVRMASNRADIVKKENVYIRECNKFCV
jgi:hypothetical protein